MARRSMLKPDPTRYPQVVSTRISGPEWIEPEPVEPVENVAESKDAPVPYRAEELPADLALDLRLHEILEHALRATAASGAVIALASGDKMVCRATSGDKAPRTGVCLNTQSGLSGLCVQTRATQRCDDTLADSRVNADACRDLDIRSIVILPILDGEKLWGILEIFSAAPNAFSDEDVRALQALSRRVSQTVHEAVEGGMSPPARSFAPKVDPAEPELMTREIFAASGQQDPPARSRDYRTTALTAAVIALAVLLGWMVGRVGWSMAVSRAQAQLPITPNEAQAAIQVTPETRPTTAPEIVEPADSVKPVDTTTAPTASSKPAPKPKSAAEPVGDLVVYEHGKVVFRMSPPAKSSPAGSDPSSSQTQVAREGDPSVSVAPPSTSPAAENGYLLERVEPEYPEAAEQARIQGPVVLNALVGTDGSVRELKVASGDPQLVKAAADAVRQWRFRPHLLKGRPVEFETRITVNFALPQQVEASP